MFQQRDELKTIGESFTEVHILDLILKSLSDVDEPIRFATNLDLKISLNEIETTMCTKYSKGRARRGGATVLRGKGRESAMTACSGFEKSCNNCSKLSHTKACFKFLRKSSWGSISWSDALRRTWCSLNSTRLQNNANWRIQQQ